MGTCNQLPPTIREKRRYVLFKLIIPEDEVPPSPAEVAKTITQQCTQLYGEVGFSQIMPKLVYYDGEWGISRCVRGKEMLLRAALATIESIGTTEAHLLSMITSGTIAATLRKRDKLVQKLKIVR